MCLLLMRVRDIFEAFGTDIHAILTATLRHSNYPTLCSHDMRTIKLQSTM